MLMWAVLLGIVGGFPRKGPRKEEVVERNRWIALAEVGRSVIRGILNVFDAVFLGIFQVFDKFGWGYLCVLVIVLYFLVRNKEGKGEKRSSEEFKVDLGSVERIYDGFKVTSKEEGEDNLEILKESVEGLKNDVTFFQSLVLDTHLSIWRCVSQ